MSAADTIRAVLQDSDLAWVEFGPGPDGAQVQGQGQRSIFEVDLPGERKLKTTCRLEVGKHALGIHAFVARNPDENHAGVYRWLLERNLKMLGVAFAVDATGDIYLDGRLPLDAVTPEALDRILGAVLTYADESFNVILELGFASAIRREWAWREERGEPTGNLAAFRHLRPQ